ncbi:MAG: ABC transporter permease [Methanolinea sp.]|nr:ABC transporter permease [Methanolinea sp.]
MTAGHFRLASPIKRRIRISAIAAGIVILGAVALYLFLPVIALFFRTSPALFLGSLKSPVVIESLKLSLITSGAATLIAVAVGTPAAYLHSRHRYPGKEIVDVIIDLPLILPPAVAGVALLMLWGRMGLLGRYLHLLGVDIAFTTLAVVMAQLFVASPLYIRQAKELISHLDKAYEQTARTLGASTSTVFLRIVVPLIGGGLISAGITTFARALGEFGATIMFAGNLPGVTQTMPLAIYSAMQGDFDTAISISIILVIISFAIMAAVRVITRRGDPDA